MHHITTRLWTPDLHTQSAFLKHVLLLTLKMTTARRHVYKMIMFTHH